MKVNPHRRGQAEREYDGALLKSKSKFQIRSKGRTPKSALDTNLPIKNMGVLPPGGDIAEMCFTVLMEATNDIDKDLRMIMDEIKATTAAKQKLRDLISKIRRDICANAGQKDKRPPLDFSTGMGSEEAYHQAQIPAADPESEPCVRFVQTDLYNGHLDEVAQLRCIQEDLKGQLDSMSEMSEMTSLRLQMAMDRRSQFIATLSNVMKKIDATQETLVQNLK